MANAILNFHFDFLNTSLSVSFGIFTVHDVTAARFSNFQDIIILPYQVVILFPRNPTADIVYALLKVLTDNVLFP